MVKKVEMENLLEQIEKLQELEEKERVELQKLSEDVLNLEKKMEFGI